MVKWLREITKIPALGAVDSHVEGALVVDRKEIVAIGRALGTLLHELAIGAHQLNMDGFVGHFGLGALAAAIARD
jgi:hypothetical protein